MLKCVLSFDYSREGGGSVSHLERGVVAVEVDAAVSGVVEALVEALEVVEGQAGDGGRVSAGVHAVRVVREDGLRKVEIT